MGGRGFFGACRGDDAAHGCRRGVQALPFAREHAHERVTAELHDITAVRVNDLDGLLEENGERGRQLLGACGTLLLGKRLGKLSIARDVEEGLGERGDGVGLGRGDEGFLLGNLERKKNPLTNILPSCFLQLEAVRGSPSETILRSIVH